VARALLIHNPVAARTAPKVLDTISRVFATEGWELEVAGTDAPGHAEDLARSRADDGVERIVVYGGDGTTMQAVKGLVGKDVPVGLIPGGTGNLLAGNLRLPRTAAAAARVAATGVPKRIDLGLMQLDDGDHHFAVACGAGFDAQLMGASEEAKRRWRMGAYVAQGWDTIADIKVVSHRITVDGKTFEADAGMVLVANCGEIIPPFLRIRGGIAYDDGVFDIAVVNAKTAVEIIDVLWQMLTGQGESHHRFEYARGEVVTVETETPQPAELDGEVVGTTPFTARIQPGAMSVVMPKP